MGTPIEHIYVYQVNWSDLSTLTVDEKASLSILSFVVSELNALKRLSLFAMYDHDEHSTVAPSIAIQRNLILRTTTAKLFEFLRFVEKQIEKESLSERLRRVFRIFEIELGEMRLGYGFKIAKQIRHKMANHLDFDEAVLSVEAASQSLDCSFYLTEASGNSYYPMGDEIVFSSSIHRALENSGEDISFQDALDAWIAWTLSLADLADRLHLEMFEEFVEPIFPNRMAHHRPQWLPEDFVASHPGFKLPVFIRVRK